MLKKDLFLDGKDQTKQKGLFFDPRTPIKVLMSFCLFDTSVKTTKWKIKFDHIFFFPSFGQTQKRKKQLKTKQQQKKKGFRPSFAVFFRFGDNPTPNLKKRKEKKKKKDGDWR